MDVRIRRVRRADHDALARLLGWSEISPRTKRMFRRIVADLAYDFYVAESEGTIAGVVAVSYVRSLTLGGQRATLEELLVDPRARRAGVGARLLAFAIERAQQREARELVAVPLDEVGAGLLAHAGFAPGGTRQLRVLGEKSA